MAGLQIDEALAHTGPALDAWHWSCPSCATRYELRPEGNGRV